METTRIRDCVRKIFAIACTLAAATACGGFTRAERSVIRLGGEGAMRVLSIDEQADSLTLRRESAPLGARAAASDEMALLRRRMLATVTDPRHEGVGIAAPQVGILRRAIAVQRFDKLGEPFEFYINPEIVSTSDSTAVGMEGCLSIPEIYGPVRRSQSIVLRYRTERFVDTTETVEGFTAVIFQHEIDHLDGVLFIDRMSGPKHAG